MLFQTKSIVDDYNYQLIQKLNGSRFNEICKPLSDRLGCGVYIVGGGIRQLVRQIQWNGFVPKNVDKFIGDHSRDFDILIQLDEIDGLVELKNELKNKVSDITGKCVDLDVIIKTKYIEEIDLWSNAVLFDGEWLSSVGLDVGEDYINNNCPNYKKSNSGKNYLKLRWLINHSWERPGNKDWFKYEDQKINRELKENFYYEVYIKKIDQLKQQYSKGIF